MRIKFCISILSSILLFGHCKKEPSPPLPTYTVKGAFLNGTTGQILYPGLPAQLELRTQPKNGNAKSVILASCVINDSTGEFSFTYSQTNITNDGAYLRVDLPDLISLGNFPVNRNVNQNVYLSGLGSLKIYMQPKSPLSIGDTLFFGDRYSTTLYTDTILKTISGYYKTLRVPPSTIELFWARGWNNYNSQIHNSLEVNVRGDPFVDSVTINY